MDSNRDIAILAAKALSHFKAHVMRRVRDATARQRAGVLAAGDRINTIVNQARTQVEVTQGQLASLSDDNASGPSLLESIESHSNTVQRYVDRLSADVAEQTRTADQAVKHVEKIAELGAKMDNVARETKVVAFNAGLEAARLGSEGRPMQVIATELRRLNGQVEELNAVVTSLADDLRSVLPIVAQISREIHLNTQRFSHQAGEEFSQVASQSTALRETVTALLAAGDTRLQSIVDGAYDALSKLQFQDPVQQDLELIDQDLTQAAAFIHALVASGGDLAAAKSALAGGGSRSHTRGLRQEQIVVDDTGATVEAGEVLLF